MNNFKTAWRVVDERNTLALQELQNEYKKMAVEVQGDFVKVKEAAEKESEAKMEEARAKAVAEAMASGNEAWESMRQQMVLRQQEESAMLRQQLHEHYDLQLAQQAEDFRIQLQEEVSKARATQSDSLPTGAEDVEALKGKAQRRNGEAEGSSYLPTKFFQNEKLQKPDPQSWKK